MSLEAELAALNQHWPLPDTPRPVVILGCGGIVNDAHLPAYQRAGIPVAGVFDVEAAHSRATAARFGIERVFATREEAVACDGVVFDLAVPPRELLGLVEAVPEGSVVLLQKPMGEDLAAARRIREVCRARALTAAVNFQLRFSPAMLAIKGAVEKGYLGRLLDLEVHIHVDTPWHLFPYLEKLPRMEILMHSIHYLDFLRSLLGNPRGVHARTVRHPRFPELASTRTSAILDYGDEVRACLSINHAHDFGPRHQTAEIRVEGDRGAALAVLGISMNYPEGVPDHLEVITRGAAWTAVELEGHWFPDAFTGTMANLQRYASGEDAVLLTGVEDAFWTMSLVEAAYESDAAGGTPLRE